MAGTGALCGGASPAALGKQPGRTPKVRKVLAAFMCHLDVGFTNTQANVMREYFDEYYPKAMQVSATMRETGGDRYVWTTGSWLLYEYLEQATPAQRKQMEQAISAGDIAWHGLPFNWQTEVLDRSMIAGALGLSQELDRRFGRKTTGGKMADVPGHSRGLVGPLAEGGVQLLHIGVNSGSTPPDVPPVFVWRDTEGAAITMLYSRHGYGSVILIPDSDLAAAVIVRNDNGGPHSIEEVKKIYADLRSQFPQAVVAASTMSEIASAVNAHRGKFPVVTQEVGDTWIYGIPSDPVKVARYREVARLRKEWIGGGRFQTGDETDRNLLRRLALAPEHTWGTDTKRYLDYDHYKPADLARMLNAPGYKTMETSWEEKRQDITDGVDSLPPALRQQVDERLRALRPTVPNQSGLMRRMGLLKFENEHLMVELDGKTGAIHRLDNKKTQRPWASPEHPLALFSYQTLSQEDFNRFIAAYVVTKAAWAHQDFGKPRIEQFGADSRIWLPTLQACWAGETAAGQRVLTELHIDDPASQSSGRVAWPRTIYSEFILPHDEAVLQVNLLWFGKVANRLPEAIWFSFIPDAPEQKRWVLEKVDRPMSPFDVVQGGNRHMHAVTNEVRYRDSKGSLAIETLDAPVVALGEKSPIYFSNEQPDMQKGLHFSLFNNAWGTNYPQWFSGDMRFRFRLRI